MPVRSLTTMRYTTAPPPPDTGPRARTYRRLIEAGMKLVQQHGLVTVAEVASAATVSRATAYRYFPSRSQLITALVEESLGPVRRFESSELDGHARLKDLFVRTFPRFTEFEAQLRAALQLSLEHWALEKAGALKEEAFRRGHRTHILDRAAAPLRARLGSAGYGRLLRALSLFYGIEPYVVLKDVWNASDREVESISRWVLDALVEAALSEARAVPPASKAARPPASAARRAVTARRS
jgi:AcrR family transcriptional regulator